MSITEEIDPGFCSRLAFAVPSHLPAALAALADADPAGRFDTAGVHLAHESDGSNAAVATDGRSLLAVKWRNDVEDREPGAAEPVTIPAAVAKRIRARKPDRKTGKRATVSVGPADSEGIISIESVGRKWTEVVRTEPVGGEPLPYRDVIPQYSQVKGERPKGVPAKGEAAFIAVDARRLVDLLNAMLAAVPDDGTGRDGTVILRVPTYPIGAIHVTRKSGGLSANGVMMPLSGVVME